MDTVDKIIEDWECDTQSNPKVDKDKLIGHIIRWLNINIDYYDPKYFDDRKGNYLAQDSADLKQKIELYLEGVDEFE